MAVARRRRVLVGCVDQDGAGRTRTHAPNTGTMSESFARHAMDTGTWVTQGGFDWRWTW
jgi:hypothetical protein